MIKAITNFNRTVVRSTDLLDLHSQNTTLPTQDDLIRSANVLAVAAMDSYFTTKYCDIVIPHLKKGNPDKKLVEILEKAGLTIPELLTMLPMQRPFRKVRTYIEYYLASYVTQSTKKIDSLFKTVGLVDLCQRAQHNANRTKLITRVNRLVQRRHVIVHVGDLDSRGKPKGIDSGDTRGLISDLGLFVQKADELIDQHIR